MFTQRTAKHQTVSANVYAGFYKSDLSTERGSRFKPVADRLSSLVKGRDAVGLGPVFAAMMRILFAVFEQVAVHLLDMVFRQRDLFPRLEYQLHGFGVASHFLVISCMEMDSSFSTSLSESLLPSMRVDAPMLSMVATLRRADRCSEAKMPKARQAPLNSSSSAIGLRIPG